MDANGSIYINGGTVVVEGPTSGADGALDYDGELKMTGGTLLAIGSSQMAQGISETSTQYGIMINLTNNYNSGAKIKVLDGNGQVIYERSSGKNFNSIVYSDGVLKKGATYTITIDDESIAEITIENILTTSGNAGMMPGGRSGGGGLIMEKLDGARPEMPSDGSFGGKMLEGERPNAKFNGQEL